MELPLSSPPLYRRENPWRRRTVAGALPVDGQLLGRQRLAAFRQLGWRSPAVIFLLLVGLSLGSSPLRGANLPEISRPFPNDAADEVATNALALRKIAESNVQHAVHIRFEGTVVWFSKPRGQFLVQDSSGRVMINTGSRTQFEFATGQQIQLNTGCVAGKDKVSLTDLLDNDGIHAMRERLVKIFLDEGSHAVHTAWFNREGLYGLKLEWLPPHERRAPIPDRCLFAENPILHVENGQPRPQGLNYHCFQGDWMELPDFSTLPVVRQGIATNFDISVCPRPDHAGISFDGWLTVPKSGIYEFWLTSDDGSRLTIGSLPAAPVILGVSNLDIGPFAQVLPGQLEEKADDYRWVEVEGEVAAVYEMEESPYLELLSGTGRMQLELAEGTMNSLETLKGCRVQVIGMLARRADRAIQGEDSLLVPGLAQITVLQTTVDNGGAQPVPPAPKRKKKTDTLPVLTLVSQVKELNRKEAGRGYPIKIRGVVTARISNGFIIQDQTASAFCTLNPLPNEELDLPEVGEYWELEGVTRIDFAPGIYIDRAAYLGAGMLPKPLEPTWDEVINGSLDTQYIEMEGVVTRANTNLLTLLTREGAAQVQVFDVDPNVLNGLDGAHVHVRGVISPDRDTSEETIVASLRLFTASITVDEPAPADPFAAPLKHVADLFYFDPSADALHRVRLNGQIVHQGRGEYFLEDGGTGVRFVTASPVDLATGDLVDVVGFPTFNGPSPLVRDALVRRMGGSPLPPGTRLSESNLFSGRLDATMVRTDARLIGASDDLSEKTLEFQAGNFNFIARLNRFNGMLPAIQPGSIVQLTGVYDGTGGYRNTNRTVDSFQILLNSPADVVVTARPSWWTFRHTLMTLSSMAALMFAASIWIALLRRQVEERSRQLEVEIRRREQTERQRALEGERSRIAQDLHDDLGATLTQIRFLSAVRSRDELVPERTRDQLRQVSEKSHKMVASLDEIVWAVNPENDSLRSLGAYLRQVAVEFFRDTTIKCWLDIDRSFPAATLSSETRHNLYLSVREAFNNIAKHSQATEAWLRIHLIDQSLAITIEDNGCGFDAVPPAPRGNGLGNMRRRLEKIGGHFECASRPGAGTVCRITLPLSPSRLC